MLPPTVDNDSIQLWGYRKDYDKGVKATVIRSNQVTKLAREEERNKEPTKQEQTTKWQ